MEKEASGELVSRHLTKPGTLHDLSFTCSVVRLFDQVVAMDTE